MPHRGQQETGKHAQKGRGQPDPRSKHGSGREQAGEVKSDKDQMHQTRGRERDQTKH
jgi:hypothetical protein